MRRALVILALVLALAADAALATAGDFVVVAGGPPEQQRLGSYRYGAQPTYAAAVRAFGAPTAHSPSRASCLVHWSSLGLTIVFSAACDSVGTGTWAGATVSSGPWRTNVGLRLGDPLATLRRRYRDARRESPTRWLLVYRRGEVGLTRYLEADVSAGRVVAFLLPLPLLSVRR